MVVDRSGVQTAKSGKKYISVRLSDLQKYDRQKVLQSFAGLSEANTKAQMKIYNKNMYRVINVMAFGDFSTIVYRICQPGTILAILQLKHLPPRPGSDDNSV